MAAPVRSKKYTRKGKFPNRKPTVKKPGAWSAKTGGLIWHPTKGPINPKADQPAPPIWRGPPADTRSKPKPKTDSIHKSVRSANKAQGAPSRERYRKTIGKRTRIVTEPRKDRSA